MSRLLHLFWFSFDSLPPFSVLAAGCGVTAYSHDDALHLLKERVFNQALPACSVIEDIDVRTLDENHVLPNMGLVTQRGVWFPLGY
ncbi:hypothetical protein [Polaromonas sp. YR568]|uniref:hypothetical protein n=1 Tax=Polaromonas sp. YR568 TaxID=1855301 RepID=UPI001114281E|nr:hypothetical protein [Polaromonas sp. YR568]